MSTQNSQLISGGLIVTMNDERDVFFGDLRIEQGKITAIASQLKPRPGEIVTSARGNFILPGLIQCHTHVCQSLFRGLADDLSLLDWLTKKIWPFEAAHNSSSMKASTQYALVEMQLLGTTSILDMGSTRHGHSIFETAHHLGMRFWGGNCWADLKERSGPIYLDTASTIKETQELIKEWHQSSTLLSFALCPRFGLSCSEEILGFAQEMQKENGLIIHTHASESLNEVELIKKHTGYSNVEYLDKLGLLDPQTVLVHGVHLNDQELSRMVETKTKLVHCPSSNLKLSSGIAPIEEYRRAGLCIGLGSDGAPCNNTMDPFMEMRLAALLQKPRFGPEALPSHITLELGTIGGARVLGQEKNIGSLEVGKAADVIVVDRNHLSSAIIEDPYSALIYSSSGRDVQHVWINGEQVVKNHCSLRCDHQEVVEQAKRELKLLQDRLD